MVGTDGDEGAAARGGDDAIDGHFGVDDDPIACRLDRPGPQLDRPVDRRRSAQADRVVGGDAAGRAGETALAHQVHRGRPVRVAVEERPDDAAVEDVVEGGMMRERLPDRPQLTGDPGHLVALDPQTVLVGRAAAEAARVGTEALLEAGFGHGSESSRVRRGGCSADR